MLAYAGHIELPVCDWQGKGGDYKTYEPEMRLFNIADIKEVLPIPEDNAFPPAGKDRCELRATEISWRICCFLSYQAVCDLINEKVKEFYKPLLAVSATQDGGTRVDVIECQGCAEISGKLRAVQKLCDEDICEDIRFGRKRPTTSHCKFRCSAGELDAILNGESE